MAILRAYCKTTGMTQNKFYFFFCSRIDGANFVIFVSGFFI